MPHIVDKAAQTAELLERRAHDAIEKLHLKDAVAMLGAAPAIREAYQGEAHPDLIWTLSLWMSSALRMGRSTTCSRPWGRAGWCSIVLCAYSWTSTGFARPSSVPSTPMWSPPYWHIRARA